MNLSHHNTIIMLDTLPQNKRAKMLREKVPHDQVPKTFPSPHVLNWSMQPFIAQSVPIKVLFVLEICLLLVHKRITIQITGGLKDVANGGHVSPRVTGDPYTKT